MLDERGRIVKTRRTNKLARKVTREGVRRIFFDFGNETTSLGLSVDTSVEDFDQGTGTEHRDGGARGGGGGDGGLAFERAEVEGVAWQPASGS